MAARWGQRRRIDRPPWPVVRWRVADQTRRPDSLIDGAGDGGSVTRADARSLWLFAALVCISLLTQGFSKIIEAERAGLSLDRTHIWVLETTSHSAIMALLPLFIPLLNRAPLNKAIWRRSLPIHLVASLGFSIFHVALMGAAREVLFPPLVGYAYAFNLWAPRNFAYEFTKDIFTYGLLLIGFAANRMIERRATASRAAQSADIAAGRLALPSGGRTVVFSPRDIAFVKAAENYVEIHTGSRAELVRITLGRLEKLLQEHGTRHVRVHRSYLVNLDLVRSVTPTGEGDVSILVGDGAVVPGSRRFRDNLKDIAVH